MINVGYVLKMNVKIIKTKQIKIILWVLGMIHAKDVYSLVFIGICSSELSVPWEKINLTKP
jgi:hypothetical protein